jgi:iron(III) transport system substrate-binding protein
MEGAMCRKWAGVVFVAWAAIVAVALGQEAAAQSKTRLTVYTALENDQLQPYKQAFEADNPDIELVWQRDSTGVITARFLAEKDNPRADVIWGLAATSILIFDNAGLVHRYTPKGADGLKPALRSAAEPMVYTGIEAFLALVCLNTAEQKKAGAPTPASWSDLTNPKFRNQIVMPHPASSGTGYMQVVSWIKTMGEEKAWAFMDRLHENIGVYTHSGSAPCVQAARGERMVGIGLDMRGVREKTQGAPLELIVPKEGLAWDLEATAIVKGTKNLAAAQRLADWSVTRKASELYTKYYAVVAHKDVNALPVNYPAAAPAAMTAMDFAFMAQNRDRILAEWTKRYESKAAPK